MVDLGAAVHRYSAGPVQLSRCPRVRANAKVATSSTAHNSPVRCPQSIFSLVGLHDLYLSCSAGIQAFRSDKSQSLCRTASWLGLRPIANASGRNYLSAPPTLRPWVLSRCFRESLKNRCFQALVKLDGISGLGMGQVLLGWDTRSQCVSATKPSASGE